jgi:uncharacterized 2Fe-2S/4Fe-4S cluster protein (DUF4445 family)
LADSEFPVKACQCLAEDVDAITLPAASLHDRGLTGVTAFDLDPEMMQAETGMHAGIALDIGTTTLAGAFWTGTPARCVSLKSRSNPQISLGDNVVSRIHASLERPDGAQELHRVLIREGVLPLLQALCAEADIPLERVERITMTGNPAMLHTAAGESLSGLASYPFRPVFLQERRCDADLLGLKQCDIRLLGGLSPFVGSDIAAGALACGLTARPGPELLIDFGTNGELLLKVDEDRYLCTATAAGPAFEGGRLRKGAAAGRGVVSGVKALHAEGAELVGEGPFHGISGAAYVDVLALGVEAERIGLTGRFPGGGELALAPDLCVTEADVAELIQAKAAIQAGYVTLLEQAGLEAEDLKRVTIAGGFGYHLHPGHAVSIGLIPPVPETSVFPVGNASLGGASLGLFDPGFFEKYQHLADRCEAIELNQIGSFEDHYIDAMLLGPAE